MRIGKLLLYAVMPMMSLAVSAQEKNPQQGDFTVALTLGYNSSVMQNAAAGNLTDYSLQAASTNWNDKALSVGIEGGWFSVCRYRRWLVLPRLVETEFGRRHEHHQGSRLRSHSRNHRRHV